jgi:hypothetical protein
MKGRLALLAGTAVGYVLGSKAGRARYEQIKAQVNHLSQNPKVKQATAQAVGLAKDKAPQAQQRLSDAARKAAEKAKGSSHRGGTSAGLEGEPSRFEDVSTPPPSAEFGTSSTSTGDDFGTPSTGDDFGTPPAPGHLDG